jgi:hypothetical protein
MLPPFVKKLAMPIFIIIFIALLAIITLPGNVNALPITTNLTICYNSTDMLTDSSGNGYNAVNTGTTLSNLPSGQPVRVFDGTSYLIVPRNAAFETQNFSIIIWINYTGTVPFSGHTRIVRNADSNGYHGFSIGGVDATSNLTFAVDTTNVYAYNTPLVAGYNQYVMTFNGSFMNVYVNGQKVTGGAGSIDYNNHNLSIGAADIGTGTKAIMKLGQFKFYGNYVLNSSEVKQEYYDGLWMAGTGQPGGVLLTFDDEYIDEWYSISDTLKDNDAKATFYVSYWNDVDTKPTFISKLKTLQDNGNEIGLHGQNHASVTTYLLTHTIDEYYTNEIQPEKTSAISEGFNYPLSFSYPFGAHTSYTDTYLLGKFSTLRQVVTTTD